MGLQQARHHSAAVQWFWLECHPVQSCCRDFRSAGNRTVAVAASVAADWGRSRRTGFAAGHPDQIALTSFVSSFRTTIQSDLRSSVSSGW